MNAKERRRVSLLCRVPAAAAAKANLSLGRDWRDARWAR
jgi:hypothetical protein